jgi:hypothetical protein
MALTKDRNTPQRNGNQLSLPVAANARIFAGSLVVVNAAGYAAPGSTANNVRAAGRAEHLADNTGGANGDIEILVSRGTFKFKNSATDPVTQADLLADCYIEDDETVAKTNGGNTRSRAGTIVDLESDGVWVEIR